MRQLAFGLVLAMAASGASAGVTSEYTDIDPDKTCEVVDKAAEGEGAWVNLECSGFGAYKVYLFEDDLRQSINYGPVDENPAWESFSAFNRTHSKIEWRLEDGVPFATIHRWFVASGDNQPELQILVVEKTGQPDSPGGCAVALIRASGNPKANEQAREIADARARTFNCGDRAERIGTVPDFGREKF